MLGLSIYAIGYGVCTYALALYFVFSALHRHTPNRLFYTLALALVSIARLPTILYNRELNADESQVISHAITLLQDPVYWRSVDGTTIGPLNNYLLVLPGLIGLPIDYISSRFLGLLCIIGALIFFAKTVQELYGERVARLATLFPVLLLSFTYHPDFLHYSSEQLPLLFLAATLYCLVKLYASKGLNSTYAYGVGFFAGLVPFAKLQAVPPALILAFGGMWLCVESAKWYRQYRSLTTLVLGGVTFPFLVLLFILFNGLWKDFIDFYITGNAIYAGGNNVLSIPTTFNNLLKLSEDFQVYAVILLIILIITGFLLRDRQPKSPFILGLSLLYLLASLYAITKSENAFVHYLNLGIYPLVFCVVHFISPISERLVRYGALVLLIYFGVNDVTATPKFAEAKTRMSARGLYQSPVVEEALKYSHSPSDQMVVWGWQCRYYVEANRPQGTAENHSERSIFEHPLRAQYRERYIKDMQRNQPLIFIDAVGKNSLWVQDTATQGYESFPELKVFIENNYEYKGTIDGDRLFILKESNQ